MKISLIKWLSLPENLWNRLKIFALKFCLLTYKNWNSFENWPEVFESNFMHINIWNWMTEMDNKNYWNTDRQVRVSPLIDGLSH